MSALGVARAAAARERADQILELQRDLFVVGAELATGPGNRAKLEPGVSLVSRPMIDELERRIDEIEATTGLPTEFVVPGNGTVAAALDVARTVIRRAERRAVEWVSELGIEDSLVVPYLNRLADLVYMMAREAEAGWTLRSE